MGLKYYNLSFFHLIFHAYFKALLFLTAGSIIHTVMDIQDLRLSGTLLKFLPISYCVSIIGFTSLAGLPFTTGFYSKESIINSSYYSLGYLSQFIYLITIITAFLTIAYSYRFLLTIYFNTTRLSLFTLKNLHYYSLNLTFSLIFISILTIFLGFFYSKMIYLYNLPIAFFNIYLPLWIKLLPLFFFIILFYFSIFFNNYKSISFSIIQNQFYFQIFYQTIAGFFLSLAYRIFYKIFDYGFLDLIFPFSGYKLYSFSKLISKYLTIPYYFSLILFFTYIFLILI